MTVGDILLGLLIACGFFLSAAIGRMFRRRTSGIIFGGVAGLAFSVATLFYGVTSFFEVAATEAAN